MPDTASPILSPPAETERKTLSEGRLYRPLPKPLAARGLYINSKIDIWELVYDNSVQASVFIYPSSLTLNENSILSLDGRFSHVIKIVRSREFENISIEELNKIFLDEARPCMPFFSHRYTLSRVQLLENSFVDASIVYIDGILRDLNPR
jgi:hypothetical protein